LIGVLELALAADQLVKRALKCPLHRETWAGKVGMNGSLRLKSRSISVRIWTAICLTGSAIADHRMVFRGNAWTNNRARLAQEPSLGEAYDSAAAACLHIDELNQSLRKDVPATRAEAVDFRLPVSVEGSAAA
jgi:hypothetical protein